jgi:16S rRNA (guanine966-N2)-methyltransferase
VIAGSAGGLRLVAARSGASRPTADRVKEALFASLGPGAVHDAAVLDLYAGSGALAIEALSRGAARALLVDRDRHAVSAMRRNLETTGLADRARVQESSAAVALGRVPPEAPFDLVFLDPPYDTPDEELARVFEVLALPGWLSAGAVVVVERSKVSSPAPVPPDWQVGWRRAYGDTLVAVATR